ncbi:MAG: tripartite tricarboxylate transporter substrate binding protein [Rhodospirillales bacterium]|nr:MAG: tripartite tricarboxylate transporter substrate binding protein [Rhodospirillales bacterium]
MIDRTTRRGFVGGSALALAGLAAGAGRAQPAGWPNKPVRFVCGYAAGGLTDIMARVTAEFLTEKHKQPFVVENKTGAGSMIAAELVAKSPPDGYTILFTNSTAMFQNRVIFKNVPYDTERDFTPIAMLSAGKVPLFVHKSVPGNAGLADLVAYAKANKTSFGTTGPGSLSHIFCVKLNEIYGLSMEPVHYRGEAPMWADLSAGVTQAACSTYLGALSALQAGNIRPVAVPTRTRMRSKLPDVRTFLEQGATHPYFLMESMVCCVAPAATPREIVDALSAGMVEANATPRVKGLVDQFGLDQGIQGRADFEAFIKEMGPQLVSSVRELNLTPQ